MQLQLRWRLLVLLVGGFLADAQPEIVILSDNITVPSGGGALLLCVGYGANDADINIVWSRMGQTIGNSSSATITQENLLQGGRTFLQSYLQLCGLQYEDSGEYTCSVTNGTQSSDGSLLVTVQGFAQVAVISNDTHGQTGGSVLLVCTGYSKPHNSSTITWLKDNQELENSATVNITLEDTEQGGRQFRTSYLRLCELRRSSSGNYTCSVSSENQTQSSTVNLYIPDDVVEIVILSNRTIGTVGTAALLTCVAYGRPEATVAIDWIRRGRTVQNSSDVTITVEDTSQGGRSFKQSFLRFCNLTYGDSADYTCSAGNGNGIFFATSEVELFVQSTFSVGSNTIGETCSLGSTGRDAIFRNTLQLISSERGVNLVGITPEYAAPSCEYIAMADPTKKSSVYWISHENGTTTQQHCIL